MFTFPYYRGTFWSDSASTPPIHQLSYRACFKPALVDWCITNFSGIGDTVYDPFAGRGTVPVAAALAGRKPVWSDVNPISYIYTRPRLDVVPWDIVEAEVDRILDNPTVLLEDNPQTDDMLKFFHPETLNDLLKLREVCIYGIASGINVHNTIAMLVMSRLHGNSPSYLSTYTMPASQAVNAKRQEKINEKYIHTPTYRDVRSIIKNKYKNLFRKTLPGHIGPEDIEYIHGSADNVVLRSKPDLIVTSPPFLDEVNYRADNWLRCWFLNVDSNELPIWQIRDISAWRSQMSAVMRRLHVQSSPDAILCWETGEVRQGSVDLAEHSAAAALSAGWMPEGVIIHEAKFNKMSTTYGVSSNEKGTNTNRIMIAHK